MADKNFRYLLTNIELSCLGEKKASRYLKIDFKDEESPQFYENNLKMLHNIEYIEKHCYL